MGCITLVDNRTLSLYSIHKEYSWGLCMAIDDYRVRFGWSRKHMADEAGIDVTTLRNAIGGIPVFRAKVGLIAEAINRELVKRGEAQIKYTDLEGVTFAD